MVDISPNLEYGPYCRNPSLGLATKARGYKGCRPREKPNSHVICSQECKMWKNRPSNSQGNSHIGSWTPGGLPNLQRVIAGVKIQWLEELFISLESPWNVDVQKQMSKMGSHDSFGHLKHKLWPKEGPGVKLAIWLPTIKSQESTQFPYLQVACDILLKSSQWGLQLCFRPHLHWRSTHRVITPQSYGSPNLGNFGIPTWESRDKKPFGCGPRGEAQSIL
jgi:hypothetical protein